MKYIDADKLKKAIEDKGLDCSFALKMERLDTLALIYELQQEQPEDLGEAAEQYADKNCHNYVENESDRNELLYAFKAGAEWTANQGERTCPSRPCADLGGHYAD